MDVDGDGEACIDLEVRGEKIGGKQTDASWRLQHEVYNHCTRMYEDVRHLQANEKKKRTDVLSPAVSNNNNRDGIGQPSSRERTGRRLEHTGAERCSIDASERDPRVLRERRV